MFVAKYCMWRTPTYLVQILIRQALKYNPASWRVPYDHVVWKDPKQILVIYSLQFLLVLLLYPIPEDGRGSPPKNYYRHYFGRLHRPQDFQFLFDGMTRILNQPVCFSRCLLFCCLHNSYRCRRLVPTYLVVKDLSNGHRRCSSFTGKPCNATNDSSRLSSTRTAPMTFLYFVFSTRWSTRTMRPARAWCECASSSCKP